MQEPRVPLSWAEPGLSQLVLSRPGSWSACLSLAVQRLGAGGPEFGLCGVGRSLISAPMEMIGEGVSR